MREGMVFHILTTAEWEHARTSNIFTPATFEQDGFIHLCKEDQIAGVVERYFRGAGNLTVLCIEPGMLNAELCYENLLGGDELFPHVYGPLNLDAVLEVRQIRHCV